MDDKISIAKFHELRTKLIKRLEELGTEYDKYGDLGDLGNEIGIVMADFITPDNAKNEWGWEEDDFKNGIRHGISLIDGTH